MLVADASAVLEALVGPPAPELVVRLAEAPVLHAPHLLDVEVLHALRGLVLDAHLTATQAGFARRRLAELGVERYPHAPLSDRIWELRHNLTAHDATYVALAEALGMPLVTADERLARVRGHRATIELYGRP